ncbi:hypothetical protein [Desulfovibrio litoralis]|uniref:Uncharacterized protein n=1 Tax=Desulfovibrio litoralis DSM 11393 TaxID=1121455 RepID=A0A1M7TR10_9BACT|nr:hypothetical protein [Desulfovibrio litoralis]SHN73140.1 hypothetical protein SAMN02745728_02384 [Desulfovibrio litoralis DSM 11393]
MYNTIVKCFGILCLIALCTLLGSVSSTLAGNSGDGKVQTSKHDKKYKALYYIAWSGYWPDDMDEKTKKEICLPIDAGTVAVDNTGKLLYFQRTLNINEFMPIYPPEITDRFIQGLREKMTSPYSEEELVGLLTKQGYSIIIRDYDADIVLYRPYMFDKKLCYPSTREEYNKFFYKNGKFTLPSFKFGGIISFS